MNMAVTLTNLDKVNLSIANRLVNLRSMLEDFSVSISPPIDFLKGIEEILKFNLELFTELRHQTRSNIQKEVLDMFVDETETLIIIVEVWQDFVNNH